MERKIKVLCIGAHPDDCDIRAGGLTAKLRAAGHEVMYVSATDGSAGHQEMPAPALRARRQAEADAVAKLFGIEYLVLPNPDGSLEATLENREEMIRIIRRFSPDIVLTHRTNDYHPDHRNTAVLVQDSSFTLLVPLIVPDTPAMRKAPCILFLYDRFQHPYPFAPDVAIATDEVIDKKMEALLCHESQLLEWLPWVRHQSDILNAPTREAACRAAVKYRKGNDARVADECRSLLIDEYGRERGEKVQYAESFEVSEYGSPLSEELRQILISL